MRECILLLIRYNLVFHQINIEVVFSCFFLLLFEVRAKCFKFGIKCVSNVFIVQAAGEEVLLGLHFSTLSLSLTHTHTHTHSCLHSLSYPWVQCGQIRLSLGSQCWSYLPVSIVRVWLLSLSLSLSFSPVLSHVHMSFCGVFPVPISLWSECRVSRLTVTQ